MKINRLSTVTFALVVFLVPFFGHAATDGIWCDMDYTSNSNANHSVRYSTYAAVVYNPSVRANTSVPVTIQNLRLSCSRTNNPPEGCDQTLGQLAGIGDAAISSPVGIGASRANPSVMLYPPGSAGSNTVVEAVVQYNSSATGSFTAPAQAGTYEIGTFGQANSPAGPNECSSAISYTVTAPASTQCSDGVDNNDNDNPAVSDAGDPECHTDCNVNNAGSYVPTHNSETTPPNGTCPATPTLNLNGRAAFLQVVKNFFAAVTAKAFAGE